MSFRTLITSIMAYAHGSSICGRFAASEVDTHESQGPSGKGFRLRIGHLVKREPQWVLGATNINSVAGALHLG